MGSEGQGDRGSGNEGGEVDGEVRGGRKVAVQRSDGSGGDLWLRRRRHRDVCVG